MVVWMRLRKPTLNCRTIRCEQDDYPVASVLSLDPRASVVAAVMEPVAAVGAITRDASIVALASSAIAAEAAGATLRRSDEAFLAISIDLLHRPTSHIALSSLQQLVRGRLVRGLKGGTVGTCRGCMLEADVEAPPTEGSCLPS